ncbi:hypothetical protein CDD83_8449 [Cordyceps sp. RAO-2017]|nr:hypothetical protein CDD83_8449 [Cordyceps sp. RAO-2017]
MKYSLILAAAVAIYARPQDPSPETSVSATQTPSVSATSAPQADDGATKEAAAAIVQAAEQTGQNADDPQSLQKKVDSAMDKAAQANLGNETQTLEAAVLAAIAAETGQGSEVGENLVEAVIEPSGQPTQTGLDKRQKKNLADNCKDKGCAMAVELTQILFKKGVKDIKAIVGCVKVVLSVEKGFIGGDGDSIAGYYVRSMETETFGPTTTKYQAREATVTWFRSRGGLTEKIEATIKAIFQGEGMETTEQDECWKSLADHARRNHRTKEPVGFCRDLTNGFERDPAYKNEACSDHNKTLATCSKILEGDDKKAFHIWAENGPDASYAKCLEALPDKKDCIRELYHLQGGLEHFYENCKTGSLSNRNSPWVASQYFPPSLFPEKAKCGKQGNDGDVRLEPEHYEDICQKCILSGSKKSWEA